MAYKALINPASTNLKEVDNLGKDEAPNTEIDFTLGLPRPYHRHRQLLKDLREAESQHIDPERFRYGIDLADARILTEPNAVVALHILELENVSIRVTSFNRSLPMFFYCLVTIADIRRISNVAITDSKNRVRVDSLLHFSIKVSQYRDSPNNKMRIELWGFQDPDVHYIISTKDIHIFQLIREIHGINKVSMWTDGWRAARIVYEFAFSYGAFGYGHSNQLKNTDCTIFEAVANSLFPRLANTPEETTESCFNVRIPSKLHLLNLNSFIFERPKEAFKIKGKTIDPMKVAKPRVFTAHQVEFQNGFPVHCKINMSIYQKEFEAEFNDVYGQLLCFTKRRERLEFLNSLMEGRLEDLRESSYGALFLNLEEGAIETIVDADDDPHQRVYPLSNPCTVYPPAYLYPEDEEFIDKFPSLTRTTGWLGRLFGYAPLYKDPHFLQPDIPIEDAYIPDPHKPAWYQSNESCLGWIWRQIRRGLNAIYLCIFPELRRHVEIPEISVTLASPQGSATDLYVKWFEDETEDITQFKARERVAKQIKNSAQNKVQVDDSEQYELSDTQDSNSNTNLMPEDSGTGFRRHHRTGHFR